MTYVHLGGYGVVLSSEKYICTLTNPKLKAPNAPPSSLVTKGEEQMIRDVVWGSRKGSYGLDISGTEFLLMLCQKIEDSFAMCGC